MTPFPCDICGGVEAEGFVPVCRVNPWGRADTAPINHDTCTDECCPEEIELARYEEMSGGRAEPADIIWRCVRDGCIMQEVTA